MAAPILDDLSPAEKDRMKVGEAIGRDEFLISPNGRYKLIMQGDGHLVYYKTLKGETSVLWKSDTDQRPDIGLARIEQDGRLYLYDRSYKPQFKYYHANVSTDANGRRAYGNVLENAGKVELRVQDDGNMVVTSDGVVKWETNTTQPKDRILPSGDSLSGEVYLELGDEIVSKNGKYGLTLQTDGNLVLYRKLGDKKLARWASGTVLRYHEKTAQASFDKNGDFRLLIDGEQKWNAGTKGMNAVLTIRDDGNVVVMSGSERQWWTDTMGPSEPGTLKCGEVCAPDEPITSPNGKYTLVYQADENLVLYGENKQVLWAVDRSENYPQPGCLRFDSNGRLTTMNRSKVQRWHSDFEHVFSKEGTAVLKVRDDGQVAILNEAGQIVWLPTMDLLADMPCKRLTAGRYIMHGQTICSPNGRVIVKITDDYKLVIQDSKTGVVIFEPGLTDSKLPEDPPKRRLIMQRDGNLVFTRTYGPPLWAANTSGKDNCFWVGDDGNAKVLKGWPQGWELGVKYPTLNGPKDRLAPGEIIPEGMDLLISKNGRYKLSIWINTIGTARYQVTQYYNGFCVDDIQGKTQKYYFLSERPLGKRPKHLTLTEKGDVEMVEQDGGIGWTTAGISTRRGRGRDMDFEFSTYDFVMQDDGNAVLTGVIDRGCSDRRYIDSIQEIVRRYEDNARRWPSEGENFHRRKQEEIAEVEQDRYWREKMWELSSVTSYPSLDWPRQGRIERGELFHVDDVRSTPDGSTTLTLQKDGNLVLYDRDWRPIWASNTQARNGQAYGTFYVRMQTDSNLVLGNAGSGQGYSEDGSGNRKYFEHKWDDVKWSTETPQISDTCYAQVHRGKLVLYINGEARWDSSKTNWKPR